jgi:hypothetical protein
MSYYLMQCVFLVFFNLFDYDMTFKIINKLKVNNNLKFNANFKITSQLERH